MAVSRNSGGQVTRRVRSTVAGLLAAAGACSGDGPTAPGESGTWTKGNAVHAIEVGSLLRTYSLHVPPSRPPGTGATFRAYPLVIVLHGSSSDGQSIEAESGMDVVADSALFLVAYPNGTGGRFNVLASDWNAGTCCGGAYRDGIDDIAFLTALIKHASQHIAVDPKRIYVAGFSAGALMAYHAGCQLSSTVAAVAVVEGSLADDNCHPAKGVSLWAVHGTNDDQVAYDEPSATTFSAIVPVVARALPPSVQYWTTLQKCTGGSTKIVSAAISLITLTGCASSTGIEFNRILGGTHGWPGGTVEPGSVAPMNGLKASTEMWKFFAKHTRT
jgi:polyhydroxybutyrate depolymerase